MDRIDLKHVVANVSPNLQTITYKQRQAGNNQSAFNVFTVFECRYKKMDKELQLVYDASLSEIMMTWVIPREALQSAQFVSGQTGAALSRVKVKDIIVDKDGVLWLIQGIPDYKAMKNNWDCYSQQISPEI